MLKVTVVQGVPDVKISLEGSLDMGTGEILKETVEGFNWEQVKSLTFCLGGLELVDSTGIGQIIGYHKRLSQQQGRVYIENNNPEIEEILELIGVREILRS